MAAAVQQQHGINISIGDEAPEFMYMAAIQQEEKRKKKPNERKPKQRAGVVIEIDDEMCAHTAHTKERRNKRCFHYARNGMCVFDESGDDVL